MLKYSIQLCGQKIGFIMKKHFIAKKSTQINLILRRKKLSYFPPNLQIIIQFSFDSSYFSASNRINFSPNWYQTLISKRTKRTVLLWWIMVIHLPIPIAGTLFVYGKLNLLKNINTRAEAERGDFDDKCSFVHDPLTTRSNEHFFKIF